MSRIIRSNFIILTFSEASSALLAVVTKKLFSRPLDSMNLRLAFQETMAHLKYIESKGEIKQKVSEVNTWSLT